MHVMMLYYYHHHVIQLRLPGHQGPGLQSAAAVSAEEPSLPLAQLCQSK